MKRKAFIPIVLCTTMAAAAGPASAQQQHVTDAHVQELIKAAANRVGGQGNAQGVTPRLGAHESRGWRAIWRSGIARIRVTNGDVEDTKARDADRQCRYGRGLGR